MRKLAWLFCFGFIICSSCTNQIQQNNEYDICIYGGTSSGIISATAGARLGLKVVVIEPGRHLGGLSSGGLGATDIGNKYAVTGIAREFYRKLGAHYKRFESWTFEPHVAEEIFNEYANHPNITVIINHRLKKVDKKENKIESVQIVPSKSSGIFPGRKIRAGIFIDCSYEGDLMASAGISYTVGREDNTTYGEQYNGFQIREKHQFPDSIDPYIIPGDSLSGLVWGISDRKAEKPGTGDHRVQAYNFRLCLTQDTSNWIPISKPRGYNATKYELLRRLIEQRDRKKWKHTLNSYLSIIMMPNGKTDINNNGPFSTDLIGGNYDYPEANFHKRKRIIALHENYIKGLLYFLGYDPSVPDTLRKQMLSWGYAKDEFTDNNGFPHQIYVREARRMIGQYVMTEHNCLGDSVVNDGIGLAAYTMDSHNCQRIVVNGMVKNEGDVQIGGFPPYPVSYRSITPKKNECMNLLVPVCLSASHIAYGSIRMEPVFMVLGQSAAVAAHLAIKNHCSVQDINVSELNNILNTNPYLNNVPPDIIVDNSCSENVFFYGQWENTSRWMRQYMSDFSVAYPDGNTKKRFIFQCNITFPGNYAGYYFVPGPGNLKQEGIPAPAMPVRVKGPQFDTILVLNLTSANNDWLFLGEYAFPSPGKFSVEIIADTLSYPALADAILLTYQRKTE
jgi:hypothetical protein